MLAKRAVALAAAVAASACTPDPEPGSAAVDQAGRIAATFVGGETCGACHAEEAAAWQGSHHDLAMQPAGSGTLLGDFSDLSIQHGNTSTRFYRRQGRAFVSTEGPDGEPAEFPIAYTFGAYPLQQYLVELEGGRLQALPLAWDSRPAGEGGQRWFDLYADEDIDEGDPLHWTGVYLRWNTMCADCHSTDLEKGFVPDDNRFETRWSSIDVDCEACHGPGSVHAADPAAPMPVSLGRTHRWAFTEGNRIASRMPAGSPQTEIEICAGCHSLRTQLTDDSAPGAPFLDSYRPSLLEPALYHPDGQILGEVYVYGSFLQSRMAAAGVTCSDCHEPHSGALRAEGNSLCAQCHLATAYDTPDHHFHESVSAGAECTACHMRSETYMVVDPRRDHSFRVPRPDLSRSLGAPNACNDCHRDQTSEWAAARIAEEFPDGRWTEAHFGQAIHAGREWAADARTLLLDVVTDRGQPSIVRATAIGLLYRQAAPADVATLRQLLEESEPLVLLAAIEASTAFDPATRVDLVQRFLTDERRVLRMAAGVSLLPARGLLSERRQADLDTAISEYLDVQTFNSDRAEGVLNAAVLSLEAGRPDEAERLLLEGIDRYPSQTALRVNLADLYRETGRSDDAEAVLSRAIDIDPNDPAAQLAMGFALVRGGRSDEALAHFEEAASLADQDPYYRYVLAIAINDSGESEAALDLLLAAHQEFPGHADTLFALATLMRDAGAYEDAYDYAERLNVLLPGDQNASMLLRELEQQL